VKFGLSVGSCGKGNFGGEKAPAVRHFGHIVYIGITPELLLVEAKCNVLSG